jgi:hypothetical protein
MEASGATGIASSGMVRGLLHSTIGTAPSALCALSLHYALRSTTLLLLCVWAGLKNMSNSKFMTTGAAYGAGSVCARMHARAALPDTIEHGSAVRV